MNATLKKNSHSLTVFTEAVVKFIHIVFHVMFCMYGSWSEAPPGSSERFPLDAVMRKLKKHYICLDLVTISLISRSLRTYAA